jgi:hypothetical protein
MEAELEEALEVEVEVEEDSVLFPNSSFIPPVALRNRETGDLISLEKYASSKSWHLKHFDPLYLHPSQELIEIHQESWVGLTDAEIEAVWEVDETDPTDTNSLYYAKVIVRAAEANLRTKNTWFSAIERLIEPPPAPDRDWIELSNEEIVGLAGWAPSFSKRACMFALINAADARLKALNHVV